jgi:hypothetical protein
LSSRLWVIRPLRLRAAARVSCRVIRVWSKHPVTGAASAVGSPRAAQSFPATGFPGPPYARCLEQALRSTRYLNCSFGEVRRQFVSAPERQRHAWRRDVPADRAARSQCGRDPSGDPAGARTCGNRRTRHRHPNQPAEPGTTKIAGSDWNVCAAKRNWGRGRDSARSGHGRQSGQHWEAIRDSAAADC